MKDKKNKIGNRVFQIALIILFAIFITIFMSNKYGYYEYQKSKQVSLTTQQIQEFEEDVKNGKDVTLENYLVKTNKNYQTSLSQLGLNISNSLAGVVESSVSGFFNYINKLITENGH